MSEILLSCQHTALGACLSCICVAQVFLCTSSWRGKHCEIPSLVWSGKMDVLLYHIRNRCLFWVKTYWNTQTDLQTIQLMHFVGIHINLAIIISTNSWIGGVYYYYCICVAAAKRWWWLGGSWPDTLASTLVYSKVLIKLYVHLFCSLTCHASKYPVWYEPIALSCKNINWVYNFKYIGQFAVFCHASYSVCIVLNFCILVFIGCHPRCLGDSQLYWKNGNWKVRYINKSVQRKKIE